MTQIIKNLPSVQETQVLSLGWKIPWRKEWLSSPVFLSGEIPWTEEPCGLQCMRSQRVRHDSVAITFTLNTSQFFNFLISKIVCFWEFASMSCILSFIGIIGHSTSLSLETFFDIIYNHSCFISVFSYLNLFFSFPLSKWGFSYTVFSKHQLMVCWFLYFSTFYCISGLIFLIYMFPSAKLEFSLFSVFCFLEV